MELLRRPLLLVPVTMALAVTAGVGPASASVDGRANCVARDIVALNAEFGRGAGGRTFAEVARDVGGLGAIARAGCPSGM